MVHCTDMTFISFLRDVHTFHQHCSQSGLHKTGIHGIQDTRQIVDGKTNDIENNDKMVGPDFIT